MQAPVVPPTPPYYQLASSSTELMDGAMALPPSPSPSPHDAPPSAYNDRVVAFLRQPKIADLLRERRPSLAANKQLRDKVSAVRAEGTAALDRLQHDVEFTILLRYFDESNVMY